VLIGLLSGRSLVAAIILTVGFGAYAGVASIVRGTLPLRLFEARSRATVTGWLLVPAFLCAAVAPVIYAVVLEVFGAAAVLDVSLAAIAVALIAAVMLKSRMRPGHSIART
jgi:hypothetical protein